MSCDCHSLEEGWEAVGGMEINTPVPQMFVQGLLACPSTKVQGIWQELFAGILFKSLHLCVLEGTGTGTCYQAVLLDIIVKHTHTHFLKISAKVADLKACLHGPCQP